MSNEVIARKEQTAALAESFGWKTEQVELLKRTIAKGATDDELALFGHICRKTGLDPFAKQIHAVKRWSAADNCMVMTIQTGIDGYRLTAERTGKSAGADEPVSVDCPLGPEKCPDCKETGGHPVKSTVKVYRIVEGQKCAWTATARWREYRQTKKDGGLNRFWRSMPYGQLEKCAEALATRKAFPAELSGLYTHDEMGQADNDATPPPPAMPKAKNPAPPAQKVVDVTPPSGSGTPEASRAAQAQSPTPAAPPAPPAPTPRNSAPTPRNSAPAPHVSGPAEQAIMAGPAAQFDPPAADEEGPPPRDEDNPATCMSEAELADKFGQAPEAPPPSVPPPQVAPPPPAPPPPVAPAPPPAPPAPAKLVIPPHWRAWQTKPISDAQRKRLFALAHAAMPDASDDAVTARVKDVVTALGYEHSKEVLLGHYDQICNSIRPGSNKPKEA